jgi:hypothetical protein
MGDAKPLEYAQQSDISPEALPVFSDPAAGPDQQDMFPNVEYFWYKENPFYRSLASQTGTNYNAAWLLKRKNKSYSFDIVMFWYRSISKPGGYLMTADYMRTQGKNYFPKNTEFSQYFDRNSLIFNGNNYKKLFFALIEKGMLFPALKSELEYGAINGIINPEQRLVKRAYNVVSSLLGTTNQQPVDVYAGGKSRKRKAKNNKTRKTRK